MKKVMLVIMCSVMSLPMRALLLGTAVKTQDADIIAKALFLMPKDKAGPGTSTFKQAGVKSGKEKEIAAAYAKLVAAQSGGAGAGAKLPELPPKVKALLNEDTKSTEDRARNNNKAYIALLTDKSAAGYAALEALDKGQAEKRAGNLETHLKTMLGVK